MPASPATNGRARRWSRRGEVVAAVDAVDGGHDGVASVAPPVRSARHVDGVRPIDIRRGGDAVWRR